MKNTVLEKSAGYVNGKYFEPGGKYGLQSRSGYNIINENGMPAPDLTEFVYSMFLLACFGDTANKPIKLIPRTSDESDIKAEVDDNALFYLNELEKLLGIQSKASLLGRIYMTYGDIKLVRTIEKIGNSNVSSYDILLDPRVLKRVEYRNRLIGFTDGKNTYNPESVIHVYNKSNPDIEDIQVNVSSNNTKTDSNNSPIVISKNSENAEDATKYNCNTICGISHFAGAGGILDLYSSMVAKTINNFKENKAKALITINTSTVKDPSARTDAFNKIVQGAKSIGNYSYIELPDGVSVDVTQLVERTVENDKDDTDTVENLALKSSYLSSEIYSGESSIFEDARARMIINDIKGAVKDCISQIIATEFGTQIADDHIISITSSLPEENEAFLETVKAGTEFITALSDAAELLKMKVSEDALPYISGKIGIDFTKLLRNMSKEEAKAKEEEEE